MARISRMTRKRLGEILQQEGLVTPDQLAVALDAQKRSGQALGEILVESGVVLEEDIAKVISRQFGLPYLDPNDYRINEAIHGVFPPAMMRRYQFVPLDKIGGAVLVATAGVLDKEMLDELESVCGGQVHLCVCTNSKVEDAFDAHFRTAEPEENPEELTGLGNMLLGDEFDLGLDTE